MPVSIDPSQAYGQAATSTGWADVKPGQSIGGQDNGAGAFVIQELTGQKRTITLRERALPYRPIVFSGIHDVEETKYPGYTKKSQQALGATEDDSEFKGAWKTRFIGDVSGDRGDAMFQVESSTTETIDGAEAIGVDSTQITSAATAADLMDDIRIQGQVLRVSWAHIVRIGRCVQFQQTWTSIHDVEWMMKFKWIGRDENAGLPSPGNATLLDMSRQMSTGYVGLHDATNFDGIDDLDPDIADLIDYKVGGLQRAVLDLDNAVESRIYSVGTAVDGVRRALTISTYIRDRADELIDDINQIMPPSMRLVPQFAGSGSGPITSQSQRDLTAVPPGSAVTAAIALRLAVQAARALKHVAARQRFQALRQLDANALAVVTLAQDEDMRALSKRWYGTPNEGDRIRDYNGFPAMVMPTGTVVVIPQRSATS